MALPTIFANLAAGNQPASLLDSCFNAVAAMGTIQCTASGTNTIALTPQVNQPTVSAYNNYQSYSFVAPNNTTGAVTVNINSVGALPLYASDGVTQIGNGGLASGVYYLITYNSALNSGGGGFQLVGVYGLPVKSVQVQKFTSNGTYTPSAGMLYCIMEVWGGGGGGGGVTGVNGAAGAGGGAGGYCRKLVTAATVGASQSVTIGAGGTAGANTGGAGGPGGTTSVGSGPILQATGGSGGTGNTSASSGVTGGAGGSGSGGDVNANGMSAWPSASFGSTASNFTGAGGCTILGGNGRAFLTALGAASNGVANTGSGGGGAGSSGSAVAGGTGGSGFVIITEFCSQ